MPDSSFFLFDNLPKDLQRLILTHPVLANAVVPSLNLIDKTYPMLLNAEFWQSRFLSLFPDTELFIEPPTENLKKKRFFKEKITQIGSQITSLDSKIIRSLGGSNTSHTTPLGKSLHYKKEKKTAAFQTFLKAIFRNDLGVIKRLLRKKTFNVNDLLMLSEPLITHEFRLPQLSLAILANHLGQQRTLHTFYQWAANVKDEERLWWASAFNQFEWLAQTGALSHNHELLVNNHPPLWIASQNGFIEAAKTLISAGVDMNLSSEDGTTPLWIASQLARPDVIDLLIKNGADYNKAQKDGISPLLIACTLGHTAIVKQLLEAGADANQADTTGSTPLIKASQLGHLLIMDMLLEHNADVNLANTTGCTPLWFACQHGSPEGIVLLLNNNAQVNRLRIDGISPLWVAAEHGHGDGVKILLKSNALVNQTSTNGNSPLWIACQNGHREAVNALIAAGADLDLAPGTGLNLAATNSGATPLCMASNKGFLDVVETLLTVGANVHLAHHAKPYATALYEAAINGHSSIVQALLAAGADASQPCDKVHLHDIVAFNGHIQIARLLKTRMTLRELNEESVLQQMRLYWQKNKPISNHLFPIGSKLGILVDRAFKACQNPSLSQWVEKIQEIAQSQKIDWRKHDRDKLPALLILADIVLNKKPYTRLTPSEEGFNSLSLPW